MWQLPLVLLFCLCLESVIENADAWIVSSGAPRGQRGVGMRLRMDRSSLPFDVEVVNGEPEVLRRTADFLSRAMYETQMPEGQRKELRRLEFQDLQQRYGATVGRRKFPSVLLLSLQDQDIVGCVGLDCQVLNNEKKRFTAIKQDRPNSLYPFLEANGVEEIVCVMANLAVRRSSRGRGVAKKLILSAENNARESGFEYVYLLVDSENLPAQKLYKKMGYSMVFRQEDATCVVSGPIGLKTQECVNLCMRKRVSRGASGGAGVGGVIQGISDFFSQLGGKKQ